MDAPVLCSYCFKDHGLRFDAAILGAEDNSLCPQCGSPEGRKLSKGNVEKLAHQFFVRGTLYRSRYGGAPQIQMNPHHFGKTMIDVSESTQHDIKKIENVIQMGFFYYGPRLCALGEVNPLLDLQKPKKRNAIVQRILAEYPKIELTSDQIFYRLRKNPISPNAPHEYDSPPLSRTRHGRLDSPSLSIMYGSQDLELCLHECRAAVEDHLCFATIAPAKSLKLLDLTEVLNDSTSEFESLDQAVHMLFLAGRHSYKICRSLALAAHAASFDGLIFPSYFSLIRTGAMPFETAYGISVRKFPRAQQYAKAQMVQNLALFGRPVADGLVKVLSINRLMIQRARYDVHCGPALTDEKHLDPEFFL